MDHALFDSTWAVMRPGGLPAESHGEPKDSWRSEVEAPGQGGATGASELATLPRIVGRYAIGPEIARGGMGVVCRAIDLDLRREVALKILLSKHADNPELARRFFEEARIAGSLQHPGVVPIYEVGFLENARPFFAMKFVGGRGLDQLLAARQDARSDLPRLLRIFEQVCHTLAFAHSRGVIHRDLKPANIMVGVFGEVLVMDWGLSKQRGAGDETSLLARLAADSPDGRGGPAEPSPAGWAEAAGRDEGAAEPGTQFGRVFGTPAYMCPEQARGEIGMLDERADVFGLGAILCEIVTGRPPYLPGMPLEIYEQALAGALSDAYGRLERCGVAGELVRLARGCLSADRDERPVHAGQVAVEVSQFIEANLRQAERDLVRFFELSLDLFCIAGFDGFFRRVNSNFSRVLGFTDVELLARPFLDFVHPDDRVATQEAVARLMQGLPVVHFRNRYRNAAGEYRWFDWTSKGIEGEGTIFAVARDVTEQMSETLGAYPAP